jgi:glycosyltransferase involved in cell wall biosynthesis
MILHVGRFVANVGERERHHKGQRLLLETFKRMDGLHRRGWELHFAGSVGADGESAEFAASLARSAAGLPVTFHFDAALDELRELYRRAAVYWHATGFGLAAEEHPAGHEHFGITTVEAMSAGAVPVVHNSGGQREVVTHGVDGFCWADAEELVSLTKALADDAGLRERLSRQAVISSRKFGGASFAAGVDRLVARLLADKL